MASEEPTTEYLYDFLYVDRQRISWYFSQIDPQGSPTEVRTLQETVAGHTTSGNVSVGLAKGELGNSDSSANSVESRYDPQWLLPLVVIERLHEDRFIAEQLSNASMGKLVLLRGSLDVIDVRLLQEIWEPIKQAIQLQNSANLEVPGSLPRNERRRLQRIQDEMKNQQDAELDYTLQIIRHMPHAVQMTFKTDEGVAWACLEPRHMTTPPGDLALKHGTHVDGSWNLLGVLDARPDETPQEKLPPAKDIRGAMAQLSLLVRSLLGRPETAFGVTPVMLFRAIKKPTLI